MSNLVSGNFPYNTYRNINMGSTGVLLKIGRGQIFSVYISNTGMAAAYVKLYSTVAAPTSSDTPTHTLTLQASQSIPWSPIDGIDFPLGIGVRAVTGVADNDTTSPGANEVVVNIEYL